MLYYIQLQHTFLVVYISKENKPMIRLITKCFAAATLSLILALSPVPALPLPTCMALPQLAYASASPRGNTPGNLQNGGAAAEADGWIYFYEDGNLCKARPGENSQILIPDINSKLSDPFWGNMNIAGGHLFFKTLHGTIYKVPLEGGTPQEFFPAKTPFGVGTCEFITSGDWLYFNYETTTGMERTSIIGRIHLDGTGGQILRDGRGAEMYWLLDVSDDTVYYAGIRHEENIFYNYRIPASGGTPQPLDFIPYTPILQVVDGWIYYRDSIDNSIKRIHPDGSGLTVIHSRPAAMSFNVAADGEWIYFSSLAQAHESAAYMRVKTDGSNLQSLGEITMYHASVAGDRIISLINGNMRMIPQESGTPRLKKTSK